MCGIASERLELSGIKRVNIAVLTSIKHAFIRLPESKSKEFEKLLSETRIAGEGQITEDGAGYIFFWSGRAAEERREVGDGLAIKSNLVKKLTISPKGINDRIMTLQLPLSGRKELN